MGRKTFRKVITSDAKWEMVSSKNKKLMDRFLKEKKTRCSSKTVDNYRSDLKIVLCLYGLTKKELLGVV